MPRPGSFSSTAIRWVYRLQRIRTLLQLDLDDAAVRNVLRTGCILLEYYQGAF